MLKTNEYFDGRVKSIAFETDQGKATVGVIAKGSYQFDTSCFEYITVISGSLQVQFPGNQEWYTIEPNEMFEVIPDATFAVQASGDVAYLCVYSDVQLYTDAEYQDGEQGNSKGCCSGNCGCH